MKRCICCHVVKDDDEFINEEGKVYKQCKRCQNTQKLYRANNKQKIIERARVYQERYKERQKQWYLENRERILERQKVYILENKEFISDQQRKRYEKNKEIVLERRRKYEKENAERLSKKKKQYRLRKAKFSVYAEKLTIDECPKEDANGDLMSLCFFCKKYFYPTISSVQMRVKSLSTSNKGESHLYCSDKCKQECPVYRSNRDVNTSKKISGSFRFPEWKKEVKERDNYTCQRCGAKDGLCAHHILPVATYPQFADDVDNGITLCKDCHTKAHQQKECSLGRLRKNKSSWC